MFIVIVLLFRNARYFSKKTFDIFRARGVGHANPPDVFDGGLSRRFYGNFDDFPNLRSNIRERYRRASAILYPSVFVLRKINTLGTSQVFLIFYF